MYIHTAWTGKILNLFNTYINQLWTSSHQYHVSISNVYYCEGCTELPDEAGDRGTADDDVESGSAAGAVSSEALDAQGAGDSRTAVEAVNGERGGIHSK